MAKLLKHHRETLAKIEKAFGVKPQVIRHTRQGNIIIRVGRASTTLSHSGNCARMAQNAVSQLRTKLREGSR